MGHLLCNLFAVLINSDRDLWLQSLGGRSRVARRQEEVLYPYQDQEFWQDNGGVKLKSEGISLKMFLGIRARVEDIQMSSLEKLCESVGQNVEGFQQIK